MTMVTLLIWRLALLLEVAIVFRGIRARLFSIYPFFFLYISSVLLTDCVLYFAYIQDHEIFERLAQVFALFVVVLGYGLILEIFKHVLSSYPGAEKFARRLVIASFVIIFCFALGYPVVAQHIPYLSSVRDNQTDLWIGRALLERDFWAAQAIFLCSIFGVISYYRIELSRNLKGMLFGYGTWLGITLTVLTLRSYIGVSFDTAWIYLQPLSFVGLLGTWLITLWSYEPDPLPDPAIRLEADYEMFRARMKSLVGAMRSHLTRAAR